MKTKSGYPNICEISKERIRQAGQKLIEAGKDIATGFKVFRLDSSNLKLWDDTPIENGDLDNLFARMDGIIDNLKPGRNGDDLVYEILLKMGYSLMADVVAYKISKIIVSDLQRSVKPCGVEKVRPEKPNVIRGSCPKFLTAV